MFLAPAFTAQTFPVWNVPTFLTPPPPKTKKKKKTTYRMQVGPLSPSLGSAPDGDQGQAVSLYDAVRTPVLRGFASPPLVMPIPKPQPQSNGPPTLRDFAICSTKAGVPQLDSFCCENWLKKYGTPDAPFMGHLWIPEKEPSWGPCRSPDTPSVLQPLLRPLMPSSCKQHPKTLNPKPCERT